MLLLTGALFVNVPSFSYAQCPMCKANVESSLKNTQNQVGKGLNTGILYLLAFPYVLVGTVGVIWYVRFRRRKKILTNHE